MQVGNIYQKILENVEILKQIKHIEREIAQTIFKDEVKAKELIEERDRLVQKLASELQILACLDLELDYDYRCYNETPKLVIDTDPYSEELARLYLPSVVIVFSEPLVIKDTAKISEIAEKVVENIELLRRGRILELEEKVRIPVLPIVADFSDIIAHLRSDGIVLLYESTRRTAYLWVHIDNDRYASIEFREPDL